MTTKNSLGAWVPLLQFAVKKGMSISTLRRHIKAGKVQFQLEAGRYLIFDPEAVVASKSSSEPKVVHDKNRLEEDLQKAHEEIAELKTLIALYEEQLPPLDLGG